MEMMIFHPVNMVNGHSTFLSRKFFSLSQRMLFTKAVKTDIPSSLDTQYHRRSVAGRNIKSNQHDQKVRRCKHSVAGDRRRVVVTGVGLVTCLGVGQKHVWQRLVNGECGISALTDPEYAKIPSKIAGLVPKGPEEHELNLDKFLSKREQRVMNAASGYVIAAAEEALSDAGWQAQTEEARHRTGVAVGVAGLTGIEDIVDTGIALRTKGYSRVDPFFITRILPNMPAGILSLRHNFQGPNHVVSTACTTGLHAIGDSSRFIQNGDADVMLCGSVETCVTPVVMAGFSRMRALSTKFNETPTLASRPFDKDRDGFVMAEGSGIMVLEEYEHALKRGAKMYGEVLGYGLSGDANHITAPSSEGDGAYRCMKNALNNAGVRPKEVGYVNAHATSTPLGDEAESKAIQKLFHADIHSLKVSSTKGAVGHLCGAAGSVEAIFTLLACHTGIIPPTVNLSHPDKEFSFQHVPKVSCIWDEVAEKRIAMTNSFGFGGTNGSLCFKGITANNDQ